MNKPRWRAVVEAYKAKEEGAVISSNEAKLDEIRAIVRETDMKLAQELRTAQMARIR
jgi:hypothetical protein